MELTIKIKKQAKLPFIVELLHSFNYIEIVNILEEETPFPEEHRILLDERLKRIENGTTTFKSWDIIKQKYERKAVCCLL